MTGLPLQTTAQTSWTVAIPSKGRPENMKRMLSFFPYANVYVDILEKDAYSAVVPKAQLHFHDSLPGQWHIWQKIMDTRQEEVVLLCDDDLEWVASYVKTYPRPVRYTDPRDLQIIVENAVNVLCDLDISLHGWNRMPHPGVFNPTNPVSFTGVLTAAFLVRGRKYRFDVELDACDLDFVLQNLLKDRILIKDMRYYWNFGVTGMAGGWQSIYTQKMADEGRVKLTEKWGSYVSIGKLPATSRMNSSSHGKTQSFGHVVNRRNNVVRIK
jgi:hypothetical protein